MPVVIKIIGLVNGTPCPMDDQYVRYYNPAPSNAKPGQCDLFTTPDITSAKRYPDIFAAIEEWKRVDTRNPTREWDGEPNRPLTVFNILIETVEPNDTDNDNRSRY